MPLFIPVYIQAGYNERTRESSSFDLVKMQNNQGTYECEVLFSISLIVLKIKKIQRKLMFNECLEIR